MQKWGASRFAASVLYSVQTCQKRSRETSGSLIGQGAGETANVVRRACWLCEAEIFCRHLSLIFWVKRERRTSQNTGLVGAVLKTSKPTVFECPESGAGRDGE